MSWRSKEIFLAFVFYLIIYYIDIQCILNKYTFIKNITSYIFLLVFKIVESVQCILNPFQDGPFQCYSRMGEGGKKAPSLICVAHIMKLETSSSPKDILKSEKKKQKKTLHSTPRHGDNFPSCN